MTRAITVDFTSTPWGTVVPRRSNSRSNSRRSSLASVRSDSPCLGSAARGPPGAIGFLSNCRTVLRCLGMGFLWSWVSWWPICCSMYSICTGRPLSLSRQRRRHVRTSNNTVFCGTKCTCPWSWLSCCNAQLSYLCVECYNNNIIINIVNIIIIIINIIIIIITIIIITIIIIIIITIIIIKPLLKIFNECRSLTGVGKLISYWRSSMNVEVWRGWEN